MRDLRDIGAGKIDVHSLNKFKYGKISGKVNNSIKKGVVFATYPSLIGESSTQETKYNTRLKQLLHWCGEDFEGVVGCVQYIVFVFVCLCVCLSVC
jgi:hypothetical protein